MTNVVEMTTNQFQQNIFIKLPEDNLSTLTENVMKFLVDLTNIFAIVFLSFIIYVTSVCDTYVLE